MRECIHLFKYGRRVILQKPLAGILTEFASQYLDMSNIDMLVPVPLHSLKLREREFNQSALLCEGIYRSFKCPVIKNNLYRTRWTLPQIELTAEERRKNLSGAFGCRRPQEFRGKRVLLIDDVYTTGATVLECSRVLKKAGAKNIDVVTLARVANL
jgi:ComF family protein